MRKRESRPPPASALGPGVWFPSCWGRRWKRRAETLLLEGTGEGAQASREGQPTSARSPDPDDDSGARGQPTGRTKEEPPHSFAPSSSLPWGWWQRRRRGCGHQSPLWHRRCLGSISWQAWHMLYVPWAVPSAFLTFRRLTLGTARAFSNIAPTVQTSRLGQGVKSQQPPVRPLCRSGQS